MKYDGIIFDLDGTLWDSTKEVLIAWDHVLHQMPDIDHIPTEEDLHGVMGLGADDLTKKLFPNLSFERRMEIFDTCAAYENDYLAKHGATLYPHLIETLNTLSKEHPLFIVSNCGEGYIQTFMKAHNVEKYITDFEYIGRTGKPKSENIKLIVERNNLQNPVYVGDTQWDCDAATAAGVPFIFAAYGFGSVLDKPTIHDFSELLPLV